MTRMNESVFEGKYLDFKTLRSKKDLVKYIIKCMSRPQDSPCGFIWQIKGNNLLGDIKDVVASFEDGTEIIEVFRNANTDALIDGALGDKLYSPSSESEMLNADKSHGIVLFSEFTGASEDVKNLAELILNGSKYSLPAGWRVIFTGNVEAGDSFWEKGYEKKFNNVEYEPKTKEVEDEYVNESFTENISVDRADKIFNVISDVYESGEISEDDYIYMDTRSITVGTLDEMYEKGLLFKSRPAREFIDFKNNSFDFELLSAYIDENF